jgi:hypothetical protein
MEFSIEEGMNGQVYTYIGYNYEEMVLGTRNALRNNKLRRDE